MVVDQSLWGFFAHAGLIVKLVIILLLVASMLSWTFIFQRVMVLRQTSKAVKQFDSAFWSGQELGQLYRNINAKPGEPIGNAAIFHAGFKEYKRLSGEHHQQDIILDAVARAMRVATSREVDRLEAHLSFLATVGSTSPYVGLFGTVWGIMTSFQSLGRHAQQATIAMVAPGISEALIATAMGLFAAIPAVIAYNRFVNRTQRLTNLYDNFQEEFYTILQRQLAANAKQTTGA